MTTDESSRLTTSVLSGAEIDSTDAQARASFTEFSHARDASADPSPGSGPQHGQLGDLTDVVKWWAGVTGAWPTQPPARISTVLFTTRDTHDASPISDEGAVLADTFGITQRIVVLDPIGIESANPDDASDTAGVTEWIKTGIDTADAEVDAGTDLLICGDVANLNALSAAGIIGLLTTATPADLVGIAEPARDDDEWMRDCAAIRDAMQYGRSTRGDGVRLLAAIGTPVIAALTGFVLQAARRRTGVLLDGSPSFAAALIAHRAAFRARDWWLPGHRGTEPAQRHATERLGLSPAIDIAHGPGEGRGSIMSAALLQATLRALRVD